MAVLIPAYSRNVKTKRILKSPPLVLVFPREKPRHGLVAACFGAASHYYDDGSCDHIRALAATARTPWHRARMYYTPFGAHANGEQSMKGLPEPVL